MKQVAALKEGTVIDHIPAEKVFAVVALLGLDCGTWQVIIGNNLPSNKMGSKGIIKVSEAFFSNEEINRIAVVAPNVILNTIRNGEVVEKRRVSLPETLKGVLVCANPKCITNNEPMSTLFSVNSAERRIVCCHYCEKEQCLDELSIIK